VADGGPLSTSTEGCCGAGGEVDGRGAEPGLPPGSPAIAMALAIAPSNAIAIAMCTLRTLNCRRGADSTVISRIDGRSAGESQPAGTPRCAMLRSIAPLRNTARRMKRLYTAAWLLPVLWLVAAPATGTTPASSLAQLKPRIVWEPIPFGAKRKAEMVAYVRRHYGSFMKPTWRLTNPHVIVIHYTDGPTFRSAWNTFASDTPDSELHELPGTCAHFVIDPSGTIYQLVSLGTMCRHTVGLNWTAIGIENVGFSDAQVMGDARQMSANLRLVRWLRCRFHIEIGNVIGHNESLSSPYHHEDVVALRDQTHGDFVHADMRVYRRRLRALGGCP
jgi:beta-N-acetylhexosaminidase